MNLHELTPVVSWVRASFVALRATLLSPRLYGQGTPAEFECLFTSRHA